jgi:hypothetical protein
VTAGDLVEVKFYERGERQGRVLHRAKLQGLDVAGGLLWVSPPEETWPCERQGSWLDGYILLHPSAGLKPDEEVRQLELISHRRAENGLHRFEFMPQRLNLLDSLLGGA